jgi:hypothetical protein
MGRGGIVQPRRQLGRTVKVLTPGENSKPIKQDLIQNMPKWILSNIAKVVVVLYQCRPAYGGGGLSHFFLLFSL